MRWYSTTLERCRCRGAQRLRNLVQSDKFGQEVGISEKDDIVRVRVSTTYYRPAEVDILIGNPSKAVAKLDWEPSKTPFKVSS